MFEPLPGFFINFIYFISLFFNFLHYILNEGQSRTKLNIIIITRDIFIFTFDIQNILTIKKQKSLTYDSTIIHIRTQSYTINGYI